MVKNDRLKVTLSGVKLDNPVIPASGTFGFGYEFTKFYDINILGSISLREQRKMRDMAIHCRVLLNVKKVL